MKIVNLTPHRVAYVADNGKVVHYETSGIIARCAVETISAGEKGGIHFIRSNYGEVENLPTQEEGTLCIVSTLVQEQSGRADLIAPAEVVRDKEGNIIGCKSFRIK